jgi:signal transduction histidine kinase
MNDPRRLHERGVNERPDVNGGNHASVRRLYTRAVDAIALVLAGGVTVVAIGATVKALTERSRARGATSAREQTVAELQARLERSEAERVPATTILTSMEEGVVLFGPDDATGLANAAAERHLGVRPSSIDALLPLGLRRIVRRAADERTALVTEAETGAPMRVLRGSAIPTNDGSVVLVVRDVTETRRLDQVRRDFVANASHELKTPAASIQAAAETIRTAAGEDPSVIPRFASQLEREAARLSRIVSDLLDLSRLESGSALDESVALDAIVRDEGERFEEPAAEAGVGLSVRAGGIPRVRGSSRDLALLVRNLVDNAIRYTRPGGKVDVDLTTDDGEVVLAIVDTGLGIPSRDLPRIFERFYRVDRARSRETGGTGLGLSIVKHVAENHGGRVEVTSELGQGTRFEVRLPATT